MFKYREVTQPLVLADLIYLMSENQDNPFSCTRIQLLNMIIKDLYGSPKARLYVIYTDDEELVGYHIGIIEDFLSREMFSMDCYIRPDYRSHKGKPLQLTIDALVATVKELGLTKLRFLSERDGVDFWEKNYNTHGKVKVDNMFRIDFKENE